MKATYCIAAAGVAPLLVIFVLSTANLNADDMKTPPSEKIGWRDLAPRSGKPFSDPFATLTTDQLNDLGFVMRVRRLIANEKLSADGNDAKEAAELSQKLEDAGIDIAWLMVQRDRVQQLRGLQVEEAAKSTGELLRDRRVSLPGYILPCKVEDGRLTEFFLVPTAGACSHEDPPPRLQVVFVSTPQGLAPPSRRTPVRVTGKISAQMTTRPTYNASGRVMVHAAYVMTSPQIKTLQRDSKTNSSPQK